jgi:hypothetical protein
MDQPLTPPPLPVLPLEYAPPALQGSTRLLRVLGWLSIGITAVGTVAAAVEVETVIVSGPALVVLGMVMIACGLARKQRALWIPGLAHLGIAGFFVMLVNVFGFSPTVARIPFPVMGGIYTIGVTIIFLKLMYWQRSKAI